MTEWSVIRLSLQRMMVPRNSEQFSAMREQSRKRILRTALELFGTAGYHQTSMETIARTAGISKGLIYNYFTGKEQLLEALLIGSIEQMEQRFIPVLSIPDPSAQLYRLVEMMFEYALEEKEFWRLYWSLMSQPTLPDSIQEGVMEKMRGVLGLIEDVFRRRGGCNPKAEAWLFAAMLDGVVVYYLFDSENCPISDIKETIYERYGLL